MKPVDNRVSMFSLITCPLLLLSMGRKQDIHNNLLADYEPHESQKHSTAVILKH